MPASLVAEELAELRAEVERLQDENRRLRERLHELPYPFYVAPKGTPFAYGPTDMVTQIP